MYVDVVKRFRACYDSAAERVSAVAATQPPPRVLDAAKECAAICVSLASAESLFNSWAPSVVASLAKGQPVLAAAEMGAWVDSVVLGVETMVADLETVAELS